jgi:hypothetical protein
MNYRLSWNLQIADVEFHCTAILSPLSDECKIFDQQFIDYVEIHTDDQQQFLLHMELTQTEECWIRFFMMLITVIFLDNYYSPFYQPSYK